MKIVETNGSAPDTVLEWVESLQSLSDEAFLSEISQTKQWNWQDLDDLSAISGILNRIDSLLVSFTKSQNFPNLLNLLDFSCILLSSTYSKSLYNSIDEILEILDLQSWAVIYKALKLLRILSSGPRTKSTKASKNTSLVHKLYVLGLGSNLNNPSPISLQDMCSTGPLKKIMFSYGQSDKDIEVPDNLKYICLNRQRTNDSLDSLIDRPLIVACQLQALSVFLQLYPDSALIQEFCKTLPEIWLLPAISELIRTPQTVEVHISAVNLLSSILDMLESSRHDTFQSQLATVAHDIFVSWDGLMLSLLREVAMQSTLQITSSNNPEFIVSVLDLTFSIDEGKHRVDISHLPAMTCFLVMMLKNSYDTRLHPGILTKAVKILSFILSHSMDMFKEVQGLQTSLGLVISHIQQFNENTEEVDENTGIKVTNASRAGVIKSLLRMIKIALAKWDPAQGSANIEIRMIVDSELMPALNESFIKKKFEIYEESLHLITHIINENTGLVSDLISSRVIISLLESLENYIPSNPKLIEIIARFLCICGFNVDGAHILQGYDTVTKLIISLGDSESSLFSSIISTNIGESLQELINSLPNIQDKIIGGCIELIKSLITSDTSNPDKFFGKVSNISKFFCQIFSTNTEIIRGFILRGGLDHTLEAFRLPILPRSFNNEFYPLTSCFKALPSGLSGQVIAKIIESLKSQSQRLQDITGPLGIIKDFSSVPESSKTGLFHILTEGDCYLEIIRVILQNWAGIANNYKDFADLLQQLSVLLRVLISEQSRLLCSEKMVDKCCEKFNISIDLSIIENPDIKSFEENLYFSCQLTIRRIFRLAMRIPSRTRQIAQEEAALAISKSLGMIFTKLIEESFELITNKTFLTYPTAYHLALQISNIMRILLHEQSTTSVMILSFYQSGGVEIFSKFLIELKNTSFQVFDQGNFSYHLVNALQILWNLSGRFLVSLAAGKYSGSNYGQQVIKVLGFENAEKVMKKMQEVVLEVLEKVSFLECGILSTHFAKSVIEILKLVSNLTKDTPIVDAKGVKALVDMGFSPQVAKRALIATGTTSIEIAMEWIFTHPEVVDLADDPEPEKSSRVMDLHQKLINALPCIPTLSTSISDLLVKIANTNESIQDNIALMLLCLIGKLANELLDESALFEITSGMAELSLGKIKGSFDQLAASIQVMQSLIVNIPEILDIVKENCFLEHAVRFLSKANEINLKEPWVGSVFSIVDILVKSGEDCKLDLVHALVRIIEINYNSSEIILKEPELISLINLLHTVTFTQEYAKEFLHIGGLKMLLLVRSTKPDAQNKSIMISWTNLLRQLCEDPCILQSSFEMSFLQSIGNKMLLDSFLKTFKPQCERNREIFNQALSNACIITRKDQVYIERNKDRKEIQGEKWGTVKTITEALAEVFNKEQQGISDLHLNSEKLISLLGDILQIYPKLISDLILLNIQVYDSLSETQTTKNFLTHLIRNIIPFRYTLKISSQKILFYYPNSEKSVTSSIYQNWIKASVKLLKSLLIKQAYKQPESPLSEIYNSLILDNNSSVVKTRKKIITEIQNVLNEHIKKNWFENEKSMTLVRCAATIIMQVLREPSKTPFATNGSVELARMLILEKYAIPRLLAEAVKGINLYFKKASSMFNLLLAPLELLIKYSLNFALKLSKPTEYLEAPIEVFHEEELSEDSPESVSEEEEEENEDDEDNEDNEENEEDDEDDDEEEEEEEEGSNESAEDQGQMNDIVIESWNTEAFWADDMEEEEEEFPRRALENRQQELFMAERALLEQENIRPHFNYRSIFRDQDENFPSSIMWGESEGDDIIQFLLQRSRANYRQELPSEPAFVRRFPESVDYIRMLGVHLSEIAQEEPLVEIDNASEEDFHEIAEVPEPAVSDPPRLEEQQRPIPEENKSQIPEGIDPSFLEALPEDIRNEILAQYQRPPRNENVANEEFLQALPLDIRNEVISQQRPPAQRSAAPDVDNATFIASLTPDLRREVLLTANEEFLSSLPPELVAEARLLQERYIHRDHLLGRQQIPKKKQSAEDEKIISSIVIDEKLANSLPICEDSLLEILFKGLYLSTPISRDIISSLFLDMTVQQQNRSKILDGLVSLLLNMDNQCEFPPRNLYGSESFLENYSKVYAIVSIRILDILQHIVICNPKASFDLISPIKYRLLSIKSLHPEDTLGFQDLISLMDQNLYKTSTSHITPLISLISAIVNKLNKKIPSLDQLAIDRLCSLLSFESLNETTVKIVVEIVTKLSEMEINKEQVAKALKYQIKTTGEDIVNYLNKYETSPNGLKEIQLLRLCKVMTGVGEIAEDIDILWTPLTNVLSEITKKETQLASTTNPILNKLLPLIEGFFISHYNRASSETFRFFTEKNCKVINLLIRQNPSILTDTFNSLVKRFPFLLDFENKRVYFKSALRELRRGGSHDVIKLNVRRHEVFMDSFHQLKVRSPAEMHGKLRVQFVNEEGLDAGGVTREWYELLSREMFNPNYALFIPSANGVSFQPNSMSSINSEHIQFFKFVGRIIGKSLCDGYSLDVYFTRSFYKHILGQEVTYQDMEDLDVDFYKSLKYLMDINLDESELHEYYFAYEEEEFGRVQNKELVADGKNKRVTEQNKMDYIKLLCHVKMTKNIQAQIDAFNAGFQELVPLELVSIFDSKELELLISGLPTVDLEDLRMNTEYHNYTENSQVILWMWEVLNEFSSEERAEFIQFVTGSSKVPLDGFKALPGIGGFQKFQIHKCFASTDRLPTAHTCMNQLDLPEYPSKERLKNRLKFAISEGKEGFGFV
ncbi:hypothetical protein SteCoe_20987 [Stentor coeruleus]|uniref:HECT-type E3 ubiquitin transferase n=1 Tax=Stentor coeruleus TaxID=5963 RepID=A0A1R2BQU7_9CILI|nr:hypothetical protein SteCoe_20987 [Stentor coeruleus]